jgi:hypothetical protein
VTEFYDKARKAYLNYIKKNKDFKEENYVLTEKLERSRVEYWAIERKLRTLRKGSGSTKRGSGKKEKTGKGLNDQRQIKHRHRGNIQEAVRIKE